MSILAIFCIFLQVSFVLVEFSSYFHREPMRRDRLIFVLFGFIYLLTLKYHRKSAIIYLILKIFTFRIVGLLYTSFNYNIVCYRRQAEHMPSICRTNILHALKIRKMTRDETVIRKCFSLKPYMLVKTNLTLKFGCIYVLG